jgi:hypothetical protein
VEICGGEVQVTDEDIIRRMRIACWVSMGKNTHTLRICNIIYNTYFFPTPTMVTRKRLIVTLYVFRLSYYYWPFSDAPGVLMVPGARGFLCGYSS